MPTRPVQGGSNGTWGTELNAWLDASVVEKGTVRTDIGPTVLLDLETSGTGAGGTHSSPAFPFQTPGSNFIFFKISSDNIAETQNFAYVNGFNIEHHYGGASAQGGRQTLNVQSYFDGGATATSTNTSSHFYLGIQSTFWATSNDGGTSVGPVHQGAGFGICGIAGAIQSATYFNNIAGGAFEVITDAGMHVNYLAGVQIQGSLQSNADLYDAALAISGAIEGEPGHIGWKNAFLIGDMNGQAALASGSTVMKIINHSTLTNAFDFSGTNFTGYLIKTSNGFQIQAPAGDHVMDIGRQDGVASTPTIHFHSGATAAGYDSTIFGSGGSGVSGQGSLNMNAGQFVMNGQVSSFAVLLVNGASGQTGDIADFQVNSATKLSVLASGQLKTIAGNEATGSSTPTLGANFPGTTTSAPYKWLKFTASDGTQVYVPAWK